jgi:Domain of unknown function (DUF4351)
LPKQRSLIFRQLNRRVGSLPDEIQVQALALNQLEVLSEALLDFKVHSHEGKDFFVSITAILQRYVQSPQALMRQ